MMHPPNRRRQSLRLPGWDYRAAAYYFVTVCAHGRHALFDEPALRGVVESLWRRIPTQPHARDWLLDEWVVMPNHLHGILLRPTPPCGKTDGTRGGAATAEEPAVLAGLPFDMRFAGGRSALDDANNDERRARRGGKLPGSLGSVVGTFKAEATRRINTLRHSPGDRVWQRGYYERIVRNDRELESIRVYIRENPARWAADRENLEELLARMIYRRG